MKKSKIVSVLITGIILLACMTTVGLAELKCYKVQWKNKYNNSVNIRYQEAHSAEYAKIKVDNNGPTKSGSVRVLAQVPLSYCR